VSVQDCGLRKHSIHKAARMFGGHGVVVGCFGAVADAQRQLHGVVSVAKGVTPRHQVRSYNRVLHQGHKHAVVLGRHHLVRHGHDFLRLGDGAIVLQRVNVHLVAVKVGVERLGARQGQLELQADRFVRLKRHDAGLVQRRLAVKQHPVAVFEVALHCPARLQLRGQRPAAL